MFMRINLLIVIAGKIMSLSFYVKGVCLINQKQLEGHNLQEKKVDKIDRKKYNANNQ